MVEIDIEENNNPTDDIYYDTGRHEDNLKRNARIVMILSIISCLYFISLKQILFNGFLLLNPNLSFDNFVLMPISRNVPPHKGGKEKFTAVNSRSSTSFADILVVFC